MLTHSFPPSLHSYILLSNYPFLSPSLLPSNHSFFSLFILPSLYPLIHSFLYIFLSPSLPLITPQFFLPSSIPHSLPPTISSPTLFSPKGSESRWHAERSAQGRQIERLNDELVRSHRAKDAVEAESRRISHVSDSGSVSGSVSVSVSDSACVIVGVCVECEV